jgi:secreted trypsin-like serine protease
MLVFFKADSGGGLISLKLGHMILSGVMMGGVGCGRPMLPGVYTRVQKYVKWIEDIVNENSPPSSFRKKRDVVDGNASYNPFEDDDHDDTNTAEEMVIKSYVQARSDRPQH